jgi:flagellar motility protein MotE (MotC chaperone)
MSDSDLTYNYFNYFTEIEEHFQRARGTSIFLLSPLDWALIETWKNAGVPLEAVLRGIDAAFEKWRAKPKKTQMVNSVAFCAQAVLNEAQRMAGVDQPRPEKSEAAPFESGQLQSYIERNAGALRNAGFDEVAASLQQMLAGRLDDLEDVEQRLGILEQKVIAALRARQSEEEALAARKALDSQLRPYRSKMTADQLAILERQYLDRDLLEQAQIPRLSLFYCH